MQFINRILTKLWVSLFVAIILFNGKAFTQCLPVASYPFSGDANDVSGNKNHGILGGVSANPILTTDRFGNANSAYQFGGYFNRNWIRVPNTNSLHFGSQMSISFWFKQCSFDGMNGYGNYVSNGYFVLASKAGDGITANPGIWCFTSTDANSLLNITFSNINGYSPSLMNFYEDTTVSCFDKCEWVHCAIVINDTIWQMYINGQLRKQKTINAANFSNANTQDLYFGRMYGGGIIWYPYNGVLDDINIYNCALSQADVTLLFGNYSDPLSSNNTIVLDSVRIVNADCTKRNASSIAIFPKTNNGPYQYSIDNGITYQASNTFSNLSEGSYAIKIKSSCTYKDTVLIVKNIPTVVMNNTVSICQGQNYTVANHNYNSTGIYHDTLSTLGGCDTIINTNLTVNQKSYSTVKKSICQGESYFGHKTNGTYIDTLIAVNGCDSLRTLQLTVSSKASPHLGADKQLCEGDSLILFPGMFDSYLWQNGSNERQFIVKQPGNYSVTVTDGCGTARDEVAITVKECDIYFPSAFTPNGDGKNDVFKILNAHDLQEYYLEIYNRWGQKVFNTKEYTKGWDGNIKVRLEAKGGTYVWFCKFKKSAKVIKMKGTVVLIR